MARGPRAVICAVCREPLAFDGPMGYVHPSGSMYGEDGHAVVPVPVPYPEWCGVCEGR
jgi:hypothetical protein